MFVTTDPEAHAAALPFEALHHETLKVLPLDLDTKVLRSFDGISESKRGSPSGATPIAIGQEGRDDRDKGAHNPSGDTV